MGPITEEASERIQILLAELEKSSGPATWQRVQELVERMVTLYGEGLSRIVKRSVPGPELNRLCQDDLVSGLLLLHGLHPHGPRERIERALAGVRPYLGSHSGDVELVGIDDGGIARLRLSGTCRGCPSSRATVEGMIRRAVEEAAPELSDIAVDGVAESVPREKGGASARWTALDGLPPPAQGTRCSIEVEGTPVLLLAGSGVPLAYRNRCPSCERRLDGAQLLEHTLVCAGCGSRFDVAHAGRSLQEEGPHLQPFPLLLVEGTLRISVPGARP